MQKQQIINVQIPQKQLKILICQINPFHKSAKNTIDRVQRSLKKYDSKSQIDLVMFPQMSFIGYNFSSSQDAQPYANFQLEGEQFQFVIQQAKRLNSYIGFGYIQKVKQKGQKGQQTINLYNSLAIVDRTGKLHCNYRKTHLYYNDYKWAKEGTGFVTFDLKNRKRQTFKCVPAICMDINPKNFTSGQYQLAHFVIQNNAEIMLLFTNWVDSSTDKVEASHIKATYQYWLTRMMPLIQDTKKQRLLVFCDRVGYQQDVFVNKKIQFYGSSCAMMLNPTYMIKNLDIQHQGYLMIQTKLPKIVEKQQIKK